VIRAIMSCHPKLRLRWEFRPANRGCIDSFDLREEAVAATRNGFHKAGTFGRIAEDIADFVDRFIKSVIEIHKRVCGPEFFLKFLATHDFAGALKQRC
jgi:hypothetical protein